MSKVGLIGGSGVYEIKGLVLKDRKTISTPYGKPSGQYLIGEKDGTEIVFLPRHGNSHNIPPHMINYRANMWGFKKLGVERIFSINAAGGINKKLKPGDIVVPDQVLDMTKNRKSTFYDGRDGVVHVDFTVPYCPELQNILMKAGKSIRVPLKSRATYVAVEGPRLESAAEIRSFGLLGGDIVGMTGMPEASLARELEICYSGISVVANYAAGISRNKLTVPEVMKEMKASIGRVRKLLEKTIDLLPDKRECACKEALKDAKI